FEAKKLV
nr:Chain B, Transmembrane emp24 domain-containing protein 9 [Bos taurus]